jgi:AcrR family transcriptional regulator
MDAQPAKMTEEETTSGVQSLERPRREPLTRQRIIRAALQIMDDEGLEAVTMRRIGRQLGVEAMSLYNHVEDKDDILDSICEEVLADFRYPQVQEWAEASRAACHEYRRLLLAHPNVITVMTERKRPFTNPESLRVYEFALDLFRSAGLSETDTVKAFNAFGGYIIGCVTREISMMIGGTQDPEHVQAHEEFARMIESADLPRLQEVLPYLLDCDVEEQFDFGLELLIEGVRARIATDAA